MIKDRDVREALETLEIEIENYEAVIRDKDSEINELAKEVDELKSEVEEYESRIEELEAALAEAYLTSEADKDESTLLNSRHSRQAGPSDEALE